MKCLIPAAALALLAAPAAAQIPVTDTALNLQQIKEYVQIIKGYALDLQKYGTQLQQYQQEIQLYVAFAHDPSLGAAMGIIQREGYGNELPLNPYAVRSLVSGYGTLNSIQGVLGRLGQLNGLVNDSWMNNHVYTPTDGSWQSQQMVANANSIAGTQGASLAAYNDLRAHLPVLQALSARAATASTPKDVADVQAALANEAAWTNNLQASLQAIQISAQAQTEARRQRDDESLAAGIDRFLADANAAGRGLP